MTREEMIRKHNELDKAETYFIGFEHNGKVYVKVTKTLRDDMLKLDRCSTDHGGMAKIRIRISAKIKAIFMAQGAQIIADACELVTDKKYNRGENFERIITEKLLGREWKKDSIAWNRQGDIEWHGMQVQIKFDGAELTNEATLARALA